ncbi:MAG TPA: hypothetical protein VFL57_19275 [Bryobacteraceae bacterium]|nr:hypothetical protein [Bryobacteraceae bacterium]
MDTPSIEGAQVFPGIIQAETMKIRFGSLVRVAWPRRQEYTFGSDS